jgi:ActR/RegA family two-component response regulator
MSKILIVDNNEYITRIFNEVLSQYNHQLTLAGTTREAFTLIDQNDFDIAFVDLELADGSGLNVLCYLRQRSPETVPTVITGNSDLNKAIDSIKAGVFRYLKKPFDVDDILEVTEQALAEHKRRCKDGAPNEESPRPLDFKNLAIDLIAILPMLLVGFIIQEKVYYLQRLPIIWGFKEVIYLTLSFAFCYSFVHFTLPDNNREDKIERFNQLKPLTIAYILFAAILFFVTDFSYGRLVLISGYVLGGMSLILARNVLIPRLNRVLHPRREGRKRLILKGYPEIKADKERLVQKIAGPSTEHEASIDRLLYRSEAGADEHTTEMAGEEHIPGEDWGSRLIKEFMDNRLRRENLQRKEKRTTVKQR